MSALAPETLAPDSPAASAVAEHESKRGGRPRKDGLAPGSAEARAADGKRSHRAKTPGAPKAAKPEGESPKVTEAVAVQTGHMCMVATRTLSNVGARVFGDERIVLTSGEEKDLADAFAAYARARGDFLGYYAPEMMLGTCVLGIVLPRLMLPPKEAPGPDPKSEAAKPEAKHMLFAATENLAPAPA